MKISLKILIKSFAGVFLSLVFILLPLISLAQPNCNPNTSTKICNPAKFNTIQNFLTGLLEGVIKIGIPVVALAIIYSGFLFVAARGNSELLTKAKDALLYSLIGAAILLGSVALAELVSNTVQELG